MRGQVTAVNLVAIFVSLIVYVALLPALTDAIDTGVAQLLLHPSAYTDITIMFFYLFPFILILSIALTAINYANPNREGR